MNTSLLVESPLTYKIIGCAHQVGNTLGTGFLESVYENALAHELCKAGFTVDSQKHISVHYDELVVGTFVADLIVQNEVLIEVKATRGLDSAHFAQCINYLRATHLPICLLINFGTSVEVKRIVL